MIRPPILRRAVAGTLAAACLASVTSVAWSALASASAHADGHDPEASVDGPDLAVSLLGGPDGATPGTEVIVVVGVANVGAGTASSTVVAVTVPPGATPLRVTTKQGSCTMAAPTVVCSFGALAAGSSVGAQLTLRTDPAAPEGTASTILATGTAPGDVADGNDTAELALTAGAPVTDLSVLGPAPVRLPAGTASVAAWSVRNAGPSIAGDVAVVVTAPSGVTVAGEACSPAPVGLRCELGPLGPGAEVPLHLLLTAATETAGRTLTAPAAPPGTAVGLALTVEVAALSAPAARPAPTAPASPAPGGGDPAAGADGDAGGSGTLSGGGDELPDALAFTGTWAGPLGIAAAGLVLAGVAVLRATRHRRRDPAPRAGA
jgi:hypothetical protein